MQKDPKYDATDPLSYAIAERDANTRSMVEYAVDEGQVMLAFQPVVAVGRNGPAFYEGLIRVMDPTGRIIPAHDFIDAVEETELGRRIDALALELGLSALRDRPDLRLSINLSARSIDYPIWTQVLDKGLAESPDLVERLILEITESSAITMPAAVTRFIDRLQSVGICVAIDDFGSGYTSMRYLKDFCFDILKIDGEFCKDVAHKPDNQALVRSIISIGQHFDMVTVAESVETREDAQMLVDMGVDCLQGFLYGAPSLRPVWRASGETLAV